MKGRQDLYIWILQVFINLTACCFGDKILMLPSGTLLNSRSMNMEKIALMLTEHGHDVTMLVGSGYKPTRALPDIRLERYNTGMHLEKQSSPAFDLRTMMHFVKNNVVALLKAIEEKNRETCENMLSDKQLMAKIKNGNYSLFILDYVEMCATILVQYLQLPSIIYSNYGFETLWMVSHNPFNPAITPLTVGGEYTDNMNYKERILNTVLWLGFEIGHRYVYYSELERLAAKYFPNNNFRSIGHCFENVSIIIAANIHFAFDFPRPVMPHIKPMSGLLRTPPRPLSSDLQTFISSAPQGVILLSFGSLMPTLEEETSELFAKVFSRLPQKVIWRYSGPVPTSLGENTKIMEWVPQNDILAHPATKLFITHCGVSSTWETLYHAVPVVAVPLFADQYHQAAKLVKRAKIGISIDFQTMTSAKFEEAITHVIGNEEYKQNAVKMSKLLNDVPMSGKDELLYWVDYVIRHRGPLFLHNEGAYKLSWYQYYLLDIILPLLVICILTLYVLKVAVTFAIGISIKMWQRIFRNEKVKQP